MTGFPSLHPEEVREELFHGFSFGYWGVDNFKGGNSCAGEEFYGEQVNRKELCLRVKTISNYRANILRKTRMKNDAEVIRCTIQNKLVD